MTSTQQPVTGTPLTQDVQIDQLGRYKYGWADADVAGASARRGIDEDVVADISRRKSEPEWMLERRLKALKLFDRKPMPDWGSDLSGIDFQNIKYFVRSTEVQAASWDELPDDIKNTYDKLGIPEAEAAYPSAVSASASAWARSTGAPPVRVACSTAVEQRCSRPASCCSATARTASGPPAAAT